jgi:hypothetical protein
MTEHEYYGFAEAVADKRLIGAYKVIAKKLNICLPFFFANSINACF